MNLKILKAKEKEIESNLKMAEKLFIMPFGFIIASFFKDNIFILICLVVSVIIWVMAVYLKKDSLEKLDNLYLKERKKRYH